LRAFHQEGKVFWFSCREDASSEVLQESKNIPGGYREVGIKPDKEGYHFVSAHFEGSQVHLRVNRAIGFLMGVPNNTGQNDDYVMTRLEVVANHKNGRRSDNYCEYHLYVFFAHYSFMRREVDMSYNITRNLNSEEFGVCTARRQQRHPESRAESRVLCPKPSR
jgi:hypothetical protein